MEPGLKPRSLNPHNSLLTTVLLCCFIIRSFLSQKLIEHIYMAGAVIILEIEKNTQNVMVMSYNGIISFSF
jgi:hypothetical protein